MKQTIDASTNTCVNDVTERTPSSLKEDFVHELMQPLSVIETLAYYLEITAENEKTESHARRIQFMVEQIHRMLEREEAEAQLTSSAATAREARVLARSAAS